MGKIIIGVLLLIVLSFSCFGEMVQKEVIYVKSSGRCWGVLAKVYDTDNDVYIYLDLSAGGVAVYKKEQ